MDVEIANQIEIYRNIKKRDVQIYCKHFRM